MTVHELRRMLENYPADAPLLVALDVSDGAVMLKEWHTLAMVHLDDDRVVMTLMPFA